MNNIDIKFLLESDIENILKKHYSKPVLYKFLLYVVSDTQKHYDHKKFADVKEAQDKILQILGDLILGKEVSVKEIQAPVAADAAYAASASAAYAAANAAYAASAAAYAASAAYAAAYAAANAAYAASAAAYAANAAYYAHQATYDAANAAYATNNQKNYLIKLILEENNILSSTFDVLFTEIQHD